MQKKKMSLVAGAALVLFSAGFAQAADLGQTNELKGGFLIAGDDHAKEHDKDAAGCGGHEHAAKKDKKAAAKDHKAADHKDGEHKDEAHH
jgi:hypothetical protein